MSRVTAAGVMEENEEGEVLAVRLVLQQLWRAGLIHWNKSNRTTLRESRSSFFRTTGARTQLLRQPGPPTTLGRLLLFTQTAGSPFTKCRPKSNIAFFSEHTNKFTRSPSTHLCLRVHINVQVLSTHTYTHTRGCVFISYILFIRIAIYMYVSLEID